VIGKKIKIKMTVTIISWPSIKPELNTFTPCSLICPLDIKANESIIYPSESLSMKIRVRSILETVLSNIFAYGAEKKSRESFSHVRIWGLL
jgi:hypothetical protein